MIQLAESLPYWGTPRFEEVFKHLLAQQVGSLPLQQALSVSSSVADTPVTVVVLGATECGTAIRVRAGIFYEGVTGGCACAGDPAPETVNNEYCVLSFDIDHSTGATSCQLVE